MTSRMLILIACAMYAGGMAYAQDCAHDVIANLFSELETIDTAGEERLKQVIDKLAAQESWSEQERSEFTLKLSDNPTVEATESERNELVTHIYSVVQSGDVNCDQLLGLRAAVHELEQSQWDAAVQQVAQRIFH